MIDKSNDNWLSPSNLSHPFWQNQPFEKYQTIYLQETDKQKVSSLWYCTQFLHHCQNQYKLGHIIHKQNIASKGCLEVDNRRACVWNQPSKDKKEFVKSDSAELRPLWDFRKDIVSVISDLEVGTRTDAERTAKTCMCKIWEVIETRVVETVWVTVEDVLQHSWFVLNDKMKYYSINITERDFTEVAISSPARGVEEMEINHLI